MPPEAPNTTYSQKVIHGTYFPHIDGIRTLAVLSVVIYHIADWLCPGGFVGVDIFFVISGFLITGGIMRDLQSDKYSIKNFYTKRIRRIIPAYTALVLFVLIISCLIYGGVSLNNIFKATFFSEFFSANIYFWRSTGGYFDATAESSPLLHLWSLGVEEQFYIFIPLLLAFLYKLKQRLVLPAILLLTLLSFALSLYLSHSGRYPTFNFYMLPTRAWELLGGSLLAIIGVRPIIGRFKNYLAFLGLLLCLAPCYLYDSQTVFPGLTALPLILGTALLISYGNFGLVGTLLQSKPFVGVGKISYSLYLWHWPLIVFWNYITDHSKNPWGLSGVFLLSLLLGYLSWRFIEMPVRLYKKWNFKIALKLTLITSGIVIIICFAFMKIPKLNAWLMHPLEAYWEGPIAHPSRQPKNAPSTSHYVVTLGKEDHPKYILWGDSHAMALSPGLHELSLRSGMNGLYINRRHMLLHKIITPTDSNHYRQLEKALQWITEQKDIPTLILVNRWVAYTYPNIKYSLYDNPEKDQTKKLETGLISLLRLLKNTGKNVILIASVPEQPCNIPNAWFKSSKLGIPFKTLNDTSFQKQQKEVKTVFKTIEDQGLATILYPDDFFFGKEQDSCRILSSDNKLYYFDHHHLAPPGAKDLVKFLEPKLLPLLKKEEVPPSKEQEKH